MKKLQNNFTTPEQSKRLLELGVPADSADCFHPTDLQQNPIEDATPTIITYQLDTDEIEWDKVSAFPCWSVGRLIEILKECINNEDDLIDIFVELQYSNDILTTILMIFRDNKAILDFSNLEE